MYTIFADFKCGLFSSFYEESLSFSLKEKKQFESFDAILDFD